MRVPPENINPSDEILEAARSIRAEALAWKERTGLEIIVVIGDPHTMETYVTTSVPSNITVAVLRAVVEVGLERGFSDLHETIHAEN